MARIPHRREILAGTAALAGAAATPAASVAAATPNRDSRLIALCAEFDRLERRIGVLFDARDDTQGNDAFDATIEPIYAQQAALLPEITVLRATTLEGLAARARTMMLEDLELRPDEMVASEFVNERLLGLVLRDLVELADAQRNPARPSVLQQPSTAGGNA
jgi:hypothetical protein